MTVKDVLPNHPVEIMVRTNYPKSLLPYLSSERIEQGLLVGYCSWDGDKLISADGDYYSVDEVMRWKNCGINWNDFPVDCKRGSACYKTRVKENVPVLNNTETVEVFRNRWVIDREPPIFSQEREYVEKWI